MTIDRSISEITGHWIETDEGVREDAACKRIRRLISEHLRKLATTDGGWSALYRDPNDGRLWEYTFPPPLPTDAELSILRVLWQRGPSTVRAVQEQLQIMREKGLVTRDESQRAHVYEAAVGEASAQRRLVDDLLERAFGGSARALVMRALSSERVSAEELNDIRALLDTLEKEDRDDK